MPSTAIDPAYVERLTRDLVRTNSVNPDLDPDGPGEADIADLVAGELAAAGLEVHRHEARPGRVSVVGRLPGAGGGRSLMLNGHIDTVSIDGMDDPLSGRVENGRLHGRGAYDMKGSVAACIAAARALAGSGLRLRGDLLVAAVADEEYASLGTADLVERYRVDGAVVTEPTALRVCRAHKGFAWFRVVTGGRAAHGSQPALGRDANVRMGRVLARLEALAAELQARDPHPLVGAPSVHAATLAGGTGISTYAERCELEVERRTVPGESEAAVVGELEAILADLREADPELDVTLETLLVRRPFEVAEGSAVVQAVDGAVARVTGSPAEHVGEGPWMDSALLAHAGVDTVVIGPDGAGAHAAEEWVELASVVRLAEVLVETARDYCGVASD